MSAELDDEAYVEGTPLTALLGDGPKVKLLAALLAEPDPDFDYTVTQLARLADLSRQTVYSHLPDLEELGVVERTESRGASTRYRLDTDHPAPRRLRELEWDLARCRYGDL